MTLGEAIDHFLLDAGTGSGYTRRTYRTALNQLLEYLEAQELGGSALAMAAINVDLLLNLATWLLTHKGVHNRTLLTYMTAIMSFVRFLQIRDWLPLTARELARLEDGIRRLRANQRPPDLIPHPPKEHELDALLAAARAVELKHQTDRDLLAKLRNIAMIETLLSTGMRVGEMVKLKRRELDPNEYSVWVTGKGNRVRKVLFSDAAWESIQYYLDKRREYDRAVTSAVGDLPVFARHDRRVSNRVLPLSTESVQNVIKDLAFAARLEERGITPHALRHYFGTRIYQATHDLAITQTALGHASPQTTRIYAQLESRALQEAHDKAFGQDSDGSDSSSSSAAISSERSAS